jgi:hypothetical protein
MSPQVPSDSRDDGADSSKQPQVGSISSFPTSDSQTPALLMLCSMHAATRFEVPVVCELVNRMCFVPLPFFLGVHSPLNLVFFVHCHPHRLFI